MTNSDPAVRERRERGERGERGGGGGDKEKEGKTETSPLEEAQAGPVATDDVILATAGYDHTIKFWAADTGVCTRTLQHPDSQVNSLEVAPDGSMLAAGGYQHIRMFDLTSGNLSPVVNFEGISKNVMTVGFQAEGRWMFTGGEDCTARIWDLKMRNLSCQRIFQANAPVTCACLHPNQQEMVVGDQSGAIHIWNLQNDQSEPIIPDPKASIQHVAIDPKGHHMAAVNNKGHCYVWALSSGEPKESSKLVPKNKILAHEGRYSLCCQFSPDSSLLVTTSADHTAKLWRTSDFTLVQELTCPDQRWVWDAAFTADSQYLITASSDCVARLWSLKTGEVRQTYTAHQKAITCLAFRDIHHLTDSQVVKE